MIYDKYDKQGDLHWRWYEEDFEGYRSLVDETVVRMFDDPRDGTLVDIGCGDGVSLYLFDRRGFTCSGVDSSASGLKLAKLHGINATFFQETAEEFEKRGFTYDYLYSLNTIEHLDRPEVMVDLVRRTRRFAVIATDDGALNVEKDKYHTREFTRKEFCDLFAGFGIEEIPLTNKKFFAYKVWNLIIPV